MKGGDAVMGKVGDHRVALRQLDDWLPYLDEHSGLPGPRGNLELVAACGEEADLDRAGRLVATGDEFATVCGIVAYGRYLGAGDDGPVALLHRYAADDRWRVREGVAMALQRAADDNPDKAFHVAEQWAADPDPLLKRAAVAAVCEPRLLKDRAFAGRALELVDHVTADLVALPGPERRNASVRTLRQALGYCWSVAIAADPVAGLALFRRLEVLQDRDIAWIVRENRKKARFIRAAAAEATARG